MYKYNVKAVLTLYSLFILVILSVCVNSCNEPELVELPSPKKNTFTKVKLVDSFTVCECVNNAHDYYYVPHVAPAGWDLSASEWCSTEYSIEYVYTTETLDDYATSTWATSPQCPEWRGVSYLHTRM